MAYYIRDTQGTKEATCSLTRGDERGFLKMRDGIQGLDFDSNCILVWDFSLIIKNGFLFIDVDSMVEASHVKYCVSFIFHTYGLFLNKLLCT